MALMMRKIKIIKEEMLIEIKNLGIQITNELDVKKSL